jgi:hypothetical protein
LIIDVLFYACPLACALKPAQHPAARFSASAPLTPGGVCHRTAAHSQQANQTWFPAGHNFHLVHPTLRPVSARIKQPAAALLICSGLALVLINDHQSRL